MAGGLLEDTRREAIAQSALHGGGLMRKSERDNVYYVNLLRPFLLRIFAAFSATHPRHPANAL